MKTLTCKQGLGTMNHFYHIWLYQNGTLMIAGYPAWWHPLLLQTARDYASAYAEMAKRHGAKLTVQIRTADTDSFVEAY
jgi:hypothetical protein